MLPTLMLNPISTPAQNTEEWLLVFCLVFCAIVVRMAGFHLPRPPYPPLHLQFLCSNDLCHHPSPSSLTRLWVHEASPVPCMHLSKHGINENRKRSKEITR